MLELLELLLVEAVPPLPRLLPLLGVPDLARLADLADRLVGGPVVAGPVVGGYPAGGCSAPPPRTRPVIVEDAEGVPVARIEADDQGDRVIAVRPFTAQPLRDHRRAPTELPPGPRLALAVSGLPATEDVLAAVEEAAGEKLVLCWLVLVGAGRGPLPAEVAWRVVRGFARLAERAGVVTEVIPVALPLLGGELGTGDPLAAEVARRYAGPGGRWRVLPPVSAGDSGRWEPVRRELERAVPPLARRGVTVFFTGLSGSGKSTLAKALTARLRENSHRTVTLLDGDEVRRLLSHGLGFSRADRDLNIRRIGFVATEVTRHGGIAVCAPIAPFTTVRAQVRAAVEEVGDLLLVYVATGLAECERRDRKGLYGRARRGEIPDFTGISSPYEAPTDADLVIDTTGREVADCLDDVWSLLRDRGYLG